MSFFFSSLVLNEESKYFRKDFFRFLVFFSLPLRSLIVFKPAFCRLTVLIKLSVSQSFPVSPFAKGNAN